MLNNKPLQELGKRTGKCNAFAFAKMLITKELRFCGSKLFTPTVKMPS